MSPELPKWLAGHSPKHGIKHKLKVAKQGKNVTFYNRAELLSFDNWLKQPWPRKDGKRPTFRPPLAKRSTGAIEKRIDMSLYEMVVCPKCNGSGRVDGDDCRA